LVAGEHVPDRFGQLAGQVDLGDLGSALAAEAFLGALIALAVDGVLAGVERRFEQPPAQVARAVFGDRAAAVGGARLDDAGAQAGVAAELGRGGEAFDVADLRRDRKRVDPPEPGRGDQQRDVAVIGTLALELDRQGGDLELEVVDELKTGVDVAPPRVGNLQPVESLAAGVSKQV
jgi:hypothetical protein